MTFSYNGFSIEINKNDWGYLAKLGIDSLKKITKPVKERVPRTYTIGLRIQDNCFVYQRGKIKLSAKQLSETLSNLEQQIISSYTLKFRRPLLEDIFEKHIIKEAMPEKAYDEPEDFNCSIYIDI